MCALPIWPFVADLVGEAQRLTGIVDNLLALARLDAGRETPREPVALDRLADDVIRAVGREEPAREIRQTGETDLVVEGNADQLGMVLRNYLSNALKYSPADQAIDVRVDRRDDLARVEVLDRGFGLSPDELPGLFQPFIRGARARGTAGVGVGLAVCRRIIEAHGGTMRARPRNGGGSDFWFEIGLVEEQRAPHASPQAAAHA